MKEIVERQISYDMVKAVFNNKGYVFFEGGDLDLNIFGIRASSDVINRFNDFVCVAYKINGEKKVNIYEATTDPGRFWLQNPINNKGCAILKEGQYRGVYKLGKHQGKYKALVQVGNEVEVYRDDNKDLVLDKNELSVMSGYFGINIHRSHPKYEVTEVNKYSAGCQVILNPKEFDELITLCKDSSGIWGDKFTYTLLNDLDFNLILL